MHRRAEGDRQRGDPADGAAAIAAAVAATDADSVFILCISLPELHQVPAVFQIGVPVLGPRDRGTVELVPLRPASRVFVLRMGGVDEDEVW